MKKSKPSILISPKYLPIATESSRYFVVTGGRGSSKSFSVTAILTLLTCQPGHTILFTRYTMVSTLISPKYLPIATEDSRYFVVTGGRGSSKSFSVTAILTMLMCEAGHTILFTRYTMVSTLISIIPEFLEKIEIMGLEDMFTVTKSEIVNIETGSKILFRGIRTSSGDQSANLKSLQGITCWIIEEAEGCTEQSDTSDESSY